MHWHKLKLFACPTADKSMKNQRKILLCGCYERPGWQEQAYSKFEPNQIIPRNLNDHARSDYVQQTFCSDAITVNRKVFCLKPQISHNDAYYEVIQEYERE